jgi:hypothetical protein
MPKTTEQILKANLNKTLNRLKTNVASKEELWTEFYMMMLQLTFEDKIDSYVTFDGKLKAKVELAGLLADECLEVYEARWGEVTPILDREG